MNGREIPEQGTLHWLASHFRTIDDDALAEYGHLPVLIRPVPDGPAWRLNQAGLVPDAEADGPDAWDHFAVVGAGLADTGAGSVGVDECLEQLQRTRAAGDAAAAAAWAQRLTAALLAEAGQAGHGRAADDDEV